MSQIASVVGHRSHTHRPCSLALALQLVIVLSAHVHNGSGRDRQHYRSISVQKMCMLNKRSLYVQNCTSSFSVIQCTANEGPHVQNIL